jgi:hypothetical protein
MPAIFNSFDDLETELSEKGYLGGEFKVDYQVGHWLRELHESYNQSQYQAITSGYPSKFSTDMKGKFNSQLDILSFRFHFEYDPGKDALNLNIVSARNGKIGKVYILSQRQALPSASAIYTVLTKRAGKRQDSNRFREMKREIQKKSYRI